MVFFYKFDEVEFQFPVKSIFEIRFSFQVGGEKSVEDIGSFGEGVSWETGIKELKLLVGRSEVLFERGEDLDDLLVYLFVEFFEVKRFFWVEENTIRQKKKLLVGDDDKVVLKIMSIRSLRKSEELFFIFEIDSSELFIFYQIFLDFV